MALFLKGLKPEVQYETVKCDPEDFQGAIKIAVQVDNQLFNLQQLKRTGHWKPSGGERKSWGKKQDPSGTTPMEIDTVKMKRKFDGKKKQKGECFNCGKKGHVTALARDLSM
jgi:hypothetical protein